MNKRLVKTIWAAAIIVMAMATQVSAATEFVCAISASGCIAVAGVIAGGGL